MAGGELYQGLLYRAGNHRPHGEPRKAGAAAGAEVRISPDGPVAGVVTSAAELPGYGPVVLAYLKTAQSETGTPVSVGDVAGTIADLPFG